MNYLKNVYFFDEKKNNITKVIIEKLEASIKLSSLTNELGNALADFMIEENLSQKKKKVWIDCIGKCKNKLKKQIEIEYESTMYMIRCLQQSIVSINDNDKILHIKIRDWNGRNGISSINGKWENDKRFIRIVKYGNISSQTEKQLKQGKLIFGFGPSASGKTYWANKCINMFARGFKNFPSTFLSIDGSIYRSALITYRYVVDYLYNVQNNKCFSIKTLYGGIFVSNKIKSRIKTFLKRHTDININLYVPETLVSWGFKWSIRSQINRFVKITGDTKWNALLIWMHKNSTVCISNIINNGCPKIGGIKNYNTITLPIKNEEINKYKCIGCYESGILRQNGESKKYNTKSWYLSIKYSLKWLKKAPGQRYMIHNTGRKEGVSLFVNYSYEENTQIKDYIEKELSNECKYIYNTNKEYRDHTIYKTILLATHQTRIICFLKHIIEKNMINKLTLNIDKLKFKNCAVLYCSWNDNNNMYIEMIYEGEINESEGEYWTKDAFNVLFEEIVFNIEMPKNNIEIFIIRHGEGWHNANKPIKTKPENKDKALDPHLTELGIIQAVNAANIIKTSITTSKIILCASILQRTWETIACISHIINKDIKKNICIIPCSHELDYECDSVYKWLKKVRGYHENISHCINYDHNKQRLKRKDCEQISLKENDTNIEYEIDWSYYKSLYEADYMYKCTKISFIDHIKNYSNI